MKPKAGIRILLKDNGSDNTSIRLILEKAHGIHNMLKHLELILFEAGNRNLKEGICNTYSAAVTLVSSEVQITVQDSPTYIQNKDCILVFFHKNTGQ